MILHFLTDDKFADYAIRQFCSPEMCSEFVLMAYGDIHYVKCLDNVCVLHPSSKGFESLISRLGQYNAIVLHGLFDPWCARVLSMVPKSVKVAWVFWGGEIYDRYDVENSFLAPCSFLLNRLHNIRGRITHRGIVNKTYEVPLELYQRIDYCLTGEIEEVKYARKYTRATFEHLWYTYYSIEETVGSLMNETCNGTNIWVGNSSSITNNHSDAFKILRRTKRGSRKVFVPLSYGAPWYRRIVSKLGHLCFGDSFTPLYDFLPRDEYNKLMIDCSTMIQAHHRAQAHGNIITALWLGMRVYLSEKGFEYLFFKEIGAVVFSLESDFKKRNDTLDLLPKELVDKNREILLRWFGKDHVSEAVKNVVQVLNA